MGYIRTGIVVAAATLFFAGESMAASSVICANKKTGALAVRTLCSKNETRVKTLDALQGEPGEQGEQGPQGVQGPAGPGGGTITGVYAPFAANCAPYYHSPALPGMNGTVGIAGTSYMSNFAGDGKFTIYNVKPGTYNLVMMQLNSLSYAPLMETGSIGGFGTSIKTNVVVTEGQVTDLGTVTNGGTSCCGNGVKEGDEFCDRMDLGTSTETCESQGWPSGHLSCNWNCTGYSSQYCTGD